MLNKNGFDHFAGNCTNIPASFTESSAKDSMS